MDAVISALYGGTEVDWFPVWLANLWRVCLWLGIVAWLAKMVDRWVWSRRVESGSLFWMRIVAFIFFARVVWSQAHNWNEPLAWDGVPITTVALICAWVSVYRYSHPAANDPIRVHAKSDLAPKGVLTQARHPRRRATDRPAG